MPPLATLDVSLHNRFLEQRELTEDEFFIGRAVESDLILADPKVSRDHARIEFDIDEARHILIDATDRRRTFVNDQPISRHVLQTGDRIAIGPYTLLYRFQPAATRPHPAATDTLLVLSPAGTTALQDLARKMSRGDVDDLEHRAWTIPGMLQSADNHTAASRLLLREAMTLVPADRGQVVLPGDDESIVVAAAVPNEEDTRRPLSESVIRQVLATGQALACLDVAQDRRFRASVSLAGRGAHSVLAVPLILGGRVGGAICLLREDEVNRFGPLDLERLSTIALVAAPALDATLGASTRAARAQQRRQADLPYPLVYRSQVMRNVVEQVLRVAATDATVLITGPSGSGKELIAAAMHYSSLRSSGPFIKVNCAAIPETLIESELFGHEKGAFTDAKAERKGRFEQADGGTLFLDEIGDMPMTIQTRLLRTLETRQVERVGGSAPINVRVRLIAATHHHLPARVKQGTFREDLWYRLDVVRIDLPPLKDRLEDVPPLFALFAESFATNMQAPPVRLGDDAVKWLSSYDWPGNVRQLRNLAERLTVFHAGEEVSAAIVENRLGRPDAKAGPSAGIPAFSPTAPTAPSTGAPAAALAAGPLKPLAEARADFERAYIRRALDETGGNITRAAEILGIARENLSRRIKQLGLEP